MSEKLNLALLQRNKELSDMEELTKRQMNRATAGETMEEQCCDMFCKVSNDSAGEYDFFVYGG